MIKQYRYIYIAFLAGIVSVALVLELLTLKQGPMGEHFPLTATMAYVIDYVLVALSLAGAFFGIRGKSMHPLTRIVMVGLPAQLDVIYYFMFYDVNVLWCLPLLAVAYVFVWPKD